MKKVLALLLTVALLLSLTACGSKKAEEKKGEDKTTDENKPTASTAELYEKAAALIEDGDYEEAYLLLKDVKDTKANEDLIALKNTLVWLPIEIVSSEPDDRLVYTYDDNGNLVKVVRGEFLNATSTYDADGNCLTYECEGVDSYRLTYTYDSAGNLIKEWDSRGSQSDYTYDANGNCLTKAKSPFYPNNINRIIQTNKTTYTYDTNGNCLTEVRTISVADGEEQHEATYTYTYDANGNCLTKERIVPVADGEEWREPTYTYTYDANGNCLTKEEPIYGKKTTYTYDTAGNLLAEELTSAYGSGHKRTYTYDSEGNLLTEDYVEKQLGQEDFWYKYAYTYDANGNLLSVDYTSSDNKNQNATYDDRTYDKYGNILTDGPYTASWKLCYYPNGMPEIANESLFCHVKAMLRWDEHTMWCNDFNSPTWDIIGGGITNITDGNIIFGGNIISGTLPSNGETVIIVKPENKN